MRKKETLEVTTVTGIKLTVDISDKACLKFGFKHRDKVILPNGNKAIIMGVGSFFHKKGLWYIVKGEKRATHWGYGNLREEGARLKGEEKKK